MTTRPLKGVLVTGATGKQGGGVIDSLLSSPAGSSEFTILAVTRSPDSKSAQALAKRNNVKIVHGDLNDVPGIFSTAKTIHPNIWGVFSVQIPMGQGQSPETEEQQGKALIDEAIKYGIKKFVYSSADRGGDDSINNPTHVPHFISKHNIEKHLIEKAKGTEMNYTILRPVAFMENFQPGFFGKAFGAACSVGLPPNRPLQLISVSDIGFFAADAFRNPDKHRNASLSLAGDDLTWSQIDQVFRDKTGGPAPKTFGFVGSGLLWASKEMGTMFEFFRGQGFGADVPSLREQHPQLMTLGDWIERKSAYARK
ncbi:hypothetical protein MBLNU457_5107t1 [Dothideomycetes sp. NU457]